MKSLCPAKLLALVALSLIPCLPLGAAEPQSADRGGVRGFGAVGDGKADDTAAIQAAVDSRAGDICLPRGVYRITRPIVVDLDKVGVTSVVGYGTARIVMAGPGPAIRFVGTHQGTAGPTTFKPNVLEDQRMPMVDGIEIVGQHDEAIGIEARGTMELTISRVHIREALHAIHLVERNRNVLISACHLYHNRGAGVLFDQVDLHQTNIAASHISYNGQGGVVTRGSYVRNLHISGCDIEMNMAAEGPPSANVLLDGSASKQATAEVAIVGCTLQHTRNAPDSANIRFIGSDQKDRRWGHFTISGNVMSDAQINIDLLHARDVAITGNTFWSGMQHDIRVVDSSGIVLGANVMDRNPQYSEEVTSRRGIVFRGCEDCTLSGTTIAGARADAGLALENCRRFNVTGLTILDCDHAGMLLKGVTDSRVSDCLVRDDRPDAGPWQALVVSSDSKVTLADNLLGPSR